MESFDLSHLPQPAQEAILSVVQTLVQAFASMTPSVPAAPQAPAPWSLSTTIEQVLAMLRSRHPRGVHLHELEAVGIRRADMALLTLLLWGRVEELPDASYALRPPVEPRSDEAPCPLLGPGREHDRHTLGPGPT